MMTKNDESVYKEKQILILNFKIWKYSVYKHWPDTCEFIPRTVELWNRLELELGLECHVITTEYRTRVHCIHM